MFFLTKKIYNDVSLPHTKLYIALATYAVDTIQYFLCDLGMKPHITMKDVKDQLILEVFLKKSFGPKYQRKI